MQARTRGGSADTELIALTVMAKRPAGPFVATIVTPETARPIASMKRLLGTLGAVAWLSVARSSTRIVVDTLRRGDKDDKAVSVLAHRW